MKLLSCDESAKNPAVALSGKAAVGKHNNSTDSPNLPTSESWHIVGPGTALDETDAFQKILLE